MFIIAYRYCSAERPSPGAEEDQYEGNLVRKHEWESTTKKASNRWVIREVNRDKEELQKYLYKAYCEALGVDIIK